MTSKLTVSCCVASGVALLTDTLTILVLDRSFGALDDILFLVGFVLMLVGAGLAAFVLTADRRPHAAWTVGGFVLAAVVLGGVGGLGDHIARATYDGTNVALKGEWSFFLIALMMLGLAALVRARGPRAAAQPGSRRPARRSSPATPAAPR